MPNEIRTVSYDLDLQLEAYRLEGIIQKFPNHFHDDYVVGFIKAGRRYLHCNRRQYIVSTGDIVIFNPKDVHSCEQIDGKTLDYRSINIPPSVMKRAVREVTGQEFSPQFSQPVVYRHELADSLHELHHTICSGQTDFLKEESFLFFISQLIRDCTQYQPDITIQQPNSQIQSVCRFLEHNYDKTVTLSQLSTLAGISKYHLLRCFTRQQGISPHNYLIAIRIAAAQKLLEQGVPLLETALRAGFSDQSHLSKFFKKLIGLTPRQYLQSYVNDAPVQHPIERIKQ